MAMWENEHSEEKDSHLFRVPHSNLNFVSNEMA